MSGLNNTEVTNAASGPKFVRFPSIGQYKNIVKHVRANAEWVGESTLPTIDFIGTVKLHGTNSAIVFNADGTTHYQSRDRILTIEQDNAGFCMWGERNSSALTDVADAIWLEDSPKQIAIFGEWCGGNIQSSVALRDLPKMFVVFRITMVYDNNGEITTVDLSPSVIIQHMHLVNHPDIKCIYDFPHWMVSIDFNNPAFYQNQLVDITTAVENECPVGKQLGVSGVGEGVVWWNHTTNLTFKVKGSKHSVTKVHTLKNIAAVDIEVLNQVKELADMVITPARVQQGADKLVEQGLSVDIQHTGSFIKWIVADCIKEERDVIISSGFKMSDVITHLTKRAKEEWFELLKVV